MTWGISIAAGLLVALAAFAVLRRSAAVQLRLFRAAAGRVVGRPPAMLAGPQTLSVLLCGTGSPLPDRDRAGPGALVAAGDRLFLVDAGLGVMRNLRLWRVPLERIEGLLLTHVHSDHIAEVGEARLQTWVAGRERPLPVYGPPGIERVVAGFEQAYAPDTGFRTAHHGPDFLPPEAAPLEARPLAIPADAATAPMLDEDGLRITAIRVDHHPVEPAYGYRFDFHGRSVVISGDTTPQPALARAAAGADVLVHEGLQPRMVSALGDALQAAGNRRAMHIMRDIPGYHCPPVEAARIANEAGVKQLVFTHLLPVLPNRLARRLFLAGVADLRAAGVTVGDDGLLVRLPGGGERIERSRLSA